MAKLRGAPQKYRPKGDVILNKFKDQEGGGRASNVQRLKAILEQTGYRSPVELGVRRVYIDAKFWRGLGGG